MREFVGLLPVLIRIGIYIVSGVLMAAGLPDDVVQQVQGELLHPEMVGAIAAGLALAWWRLAAWAGWRT